MSSEIKLKSGYLSENSGDSVMISQEFSHENAVREVSVKSVAFGNATVYTSVTSSGSVSVGPTPYPSSAVMTRLIGVTATPVMTSVVKNAGDSTSVTLSLTATDGPIYTSDDNGNPVMVFGPVTFTKTSFQSKTKRDLNHLYNVNKNGEYIVKSYDSPLLESKTSSGLLRTNPQLTGNVKLTVDSNQHIWLNSIDATKDLADSRFKRFPLSSSSNYVSDIYKFFDNGSTPPEAVFALYEQAGSYFSTQRNLSQQYDRFYTYGAQQLNDKFYEEDFSFFAPLRIGEILPEYFVIFRANGPVNEFTYDNPVEDWKSHVNADILKKADIVKVFDMGPNSHIGKYIRNLQNHPSRKDAEMTVSFQTDGYTTFNGISYTEASFAQKGELLADYFATSNTILNTEEFLTFGFQRNKLISSSILNLEFLFDDVDAEEYTINRYFGLYLKKNEIASFFLSDKALEQYSLAIGQTPLPRKGVDGNKLSSRSFTQTNPDGIKLYVNTTSLQRTSDIADIFTTLVLETGPYGSNYLYFAGEWENNPYVAVGDEIRFGLTSSVVASATISSISQEDTRAKIEISGYTASVPSLTPDLLGGHWVDFYTEAKVEERNLLTFDNSLVQSELRLFYLEDKLGNFYNINSTRQVPTKVDNFTYLTDIEIALNEKKAEISNFGGVQDILTQAVAELTVDDGEAVMEFEVVDTFKDFDYIEIEMGNLNITEPTRWRIKAQTPLLQPGEVWPDFSTVTDTDGSLYYMTLFHPGDTSLSQVAQTIADAFKVFDFRIFDVVADGNKVFFKSRIKGSTSNGMKITFSLEKNSVKVYDHMCPIGTNSVNFMGGSDKKKNRVKIPRDIAKGILSDVEYFKTVGSYSLLKKFEVFGNYVTYFSNLQKAVTNDFDEVIDYENKNDYAIIEVADDTHFAFTQDKKVTSSSVFRSKFGVFSFFPLRDFDTDTWSSDYAKNYNVELKEYFQNMGAISFSIPASHDSVLFPNPMGLTGDYSFIGVFNDGRPPRDYNGLAYLHFNAETDAQAELYFYTGPSGSWTINTPPISLVGAEAPDNIVILPGDKILYFNENLLSKFKGFLSLTSVITEEDLKEFAFLESQWDFNRFFFNRISSEYQRLYENYQKDEALKSKVVPYVMKWISPDGKDIRDNPYRFNYSRAFGTMNFSPSGDYPDADTRNHTHEWPYLANVPSSVDPISNAPFTFSYLFDAPDFNKYNFESVSKDWFSEYFVTGFPSELYTTLSQSEIAQRLEAGDSIPYEIVPVEATEKYSVFKYDPIAQKTYTLFRGIRIEIGDKLSTDGGVLLGSAKYQDYKFSSVVVPIPENDFIYQDEVVFEQIVNEKFKFILNIIKVKISSYKNREGDISYVDLYTMENKREKAVYMMNNAKLNRVGDFYYTKAIPSDVNFPAPINFQSTTLASGNLVFNLFYNTKGSLKNYIFPLASGSYSFIFGKFTNGVNENVSTFANVRSVLDKGFTIAQADAKYHVFDSVFSRVFNKTLPTPSPDWPKYLFYYASGGDSFYNKTRSNISFYEISRILQNTSTASVKKTVTSIDSAGNVNNYTKLIFRVVTPDKFLRESELIPVPDLDKPSELFAYDLIGMDLVENFNPQYIYRYQGNFIPKTKNVFFFGAREETRFSFLYDNDFKLGNTFLADVLQDTFYLRNQYFSKVADQEILRIDQKGGYKSVYPLVNEISIDYRDIFMWSSSWDNLYYRKYSTVSNFTEVKGTEEMKEFKSFLGSKAMKIAKEFSLYEFTLNGDSPDVTWTVDGLKNTVDIDLSSKFLRYLLGDSVDSRGKKEFEKIAQSNSSIISPADVDTLASSYLSTNIVNLFQVSRVNFYLLETGAPGDPARPLIEFNTSADGVETTLTEKELIKKKYIYRKDVKTTMLSNLKIRIEFNADSRFYTSLGFGVNISRI